MSANRAIRVFAWEEVWAIDLPLAVAKLFAALVLAKVLPSRGLV
jgi:hypothetical protein